MKKIVAILITVLILASASLVYAAEQPDTTNIVADIVIVRPLGFAALIGGSVLYIVSLPIAAITHSTDRTYQALVKEPCEFVFKRPIGEFSSDL
jgi:hypothetical protein